MQSGRDDDLRPTGSSANEGHTGASGSNQRAKLRSIPSRCRRTPPRNKRMFSPWHWIKTWTSSRTRHRSCHRLTRTRASWVTLPLAPAHRSSPLQCLTHQSAMRTHPRTMVRWRADVHPGLLFARGALAHSRALRCCSPCRFSPRRVRTHWRRGCFKSQSVAFEFVRTMS